MGRGRGRILALITYPSILFCIYTIYILQHRKEPSISKLNSNRDLQFSAEPSQFLFRHLLAKEGEKSDEGKTDDKNEDAEPGSGNASGDVVVHDESEPVQGTPVPPKKNLQVSPTRSTEGKPEKGKGKPKIPPVVPSLADNSNHTNDTVTMPTTCSTGSTTTATSSSDRTINRRRIHVDAWKDKDNETCVAPAFLEFPADLFTNEQREGGAVIIHVLVGIYMFYALAVVCDSYFVNSLETICEKIGLSEDVAGATFMAAGSSAPELFASILGVFVAKGDVGTGTIVGSAVFNVLFVIGACGLFSGQVSDLNWWPLLRDSIYYAFTIILLICILADGSIAWWESVIMLFFYLVYIIIMKYNIQLKSWLVERTPLRLMDELTQSSRGILEPNLTGKVHSSYVQFNNETSAEYSEYQYSEASPPLDICLRDHRRRMTLVEAFYLMMTTKHFKPLTRFRSAAKRLILEYRRQKAEGPPNLSEIKMDVPDGFPKKDSLPSNESSPDEWRRVPSLGEGVLQVVSWVVTLPVQATLYYTIPNCRKQEWERWFLLTFISSMLWIAVFSYILVWMVVLVGYTCGIPDSIMGITFLAAGTSVPDALSSLIVAKQGQGDMAVSNSIGSNVFDVLLGLALPWFIQTAIVMPGTNIYVNSRGMVYNVILLFLSVGAFIFSVHNNNWQLNARLGLILMAAYVVFLVFAILIEFNIFGFVNLPECEV